MSAKATSHAQYVENVGEYKIEKVSTYFTPLGSAILRGKPIQNGIRNLEVPSSILSRSNGFRGSILGQNISKPLSGTFEIYV